MLWFFYLDRLSRRILYSSSKASIPPMYMSTTSATTINLNKSYYLKFTKKMCFSNYHRVSISRNNISRVKISHITCQVQNFGSRVFYVQPAFLPHPVSLSISFKMLSAGINTWNIRILPCLNLKKEYKKDGLSLI